MFGEIVFRKKAWCDVTRSVASALKHSETRGPQTDSLCISEIELLSIACGPGCMKLYSRVNESFD